MSSSSCESDYDDDLDSCIVPFQNPRSIGKFLNKYPIPVYPSQLSEKPKRSGDVLTSLDSLKAFEEKEKG